MKRKKVLIMCLLMSCCMLFASCLEAASKDIGFQAEGTKTEDEVPFASKAYVVNTMEDLRNLTLDSEEVTVTVKGYYEAGDGGNGVFYWNSTSKAKDNGGTVIKSNKYENGRFFRLCEENRLNAKWFGAKGDGKTDDYNAIQNAINALPKNGGTVVLGGGNFLVSQTIQIGNGNAGDTWSACQAVKLEGQGSGLGVHSSAVPTVITASKNMDSVISVNGLISGVVLKGFYVSGNLKAKNGIYLHAFCGLQMEDVRVQQFKEKGLFIMGGDAPTGNYNIYNRFNNVVVTATSDNSVCLFIDGNYENSNDTWLSVFNNCRFDTASTENSTSAYFKFVDSISFYSCTFNGDDASNTGIVFDAMDNKDFPSGIGFYNCSVKNTKVIEDAEHQIRCEYFYGFSTTNGEEIPTHNRLFGITDTGLPFNMDSLGDMGSGSEAGKLNLVEKRGTFDLYSTAEYSHRNLSASKEEIGILFNASSSLKGGTLYLPSYGDNVGTITVNVYKWDTDYDTTKQSPVLYTKSFVNFTDNTYMSFEISEDFGKGYYFVTITGTTEEGDYGVGVWTQNKIGGIRTYSNGNEVDFGVVGQFTVK